VFERERECKVCKADNLIMTREGGGGVEHCIIRLEDTVAHSNTIDSVRTGKQHFTLAARREEVTTPHTVSVSTNSHHSLKRTRTNAFKVASLVSMICHAERIPACFFLYYQPNR